MEEHVILLIQAGVTVDLLVQNGGEDGWHIGIRLRTFGKNTPKNRMVLAEGDTFAEALEVAIEKAKQRRWEALDWAARPWVTPTREWGGDVFGL